MTDDHAARWLDARARAHITALDAAFVAYLHGDITLAEFESLEDALRPDYAAIARALAETQRDVPWWRRVWRWFR